MLPVLTSLSPAALVASAGLLFIAGAYLITPRRKNHRTSLMDDTSAHVFAFRNKELVNATSLARDALSEADLDEDIYHQLIDRLSALFPDVESYVSGIEDSGTPVELLEVTADGPAELKIETRDGLVIVSIKGMAAPLARTIVVDEDQVLRERAERLLLRSAIAASPVPTWREGPSGGIDWVNAAYADLVDASSANTHVGQWPPLRLFEAGPIRTGGDAPKMRRSAVQMADGSTRMYETVSVPQDGCVMNFALDATATALAEDSLRNFLQTLTQTFAYLPIGLAIFDSARQLVMFNPALLDLTELKPAWLSARPTLYDVLNALREKRMVPERKDFKDWRSQLVEVEKAAKNGTFSETWTLPDGRIYRVTGRPHPEGAIAFLIEDISAEMTLKRKFRRDLETQNTIMDNLPEAFVVFDIRGMVQKMNKPFAEMWQIDKDEAIGTLSAIELTQHWRKACHPTPIWGDLRDYIRQQSNRAEWSASVIDENRRMLNCRIAPLPAGATLVSFSEPVNASIPRTHIRRKSPSTLSA